MNKFSIVQTDISYEKCEKHTDFGNMESIVLYTKDYSNYLLVSKVKSKTRRIAMTLLGS